MPQSVTGLAQWLINRNPSLNANIIIPLLISEVMTSYNLLLVFGGHDRRSVGLVSTRSEFQPIPVWPILSKRSECVEWEGLMSL